MRTSGEGVKNSANVINGSIPQGRAISKSAQGEPAPCSKPPVDIDVKVAF